MTRPRPNLRLLAAILSAPTSSAPAPVRVGVVE